MSRSPSYDETMSVPAYPIPLRARSHGVLTSSNQVSSTDSQDFSSLQQTQSLPHLVEPWMLDGPPCPSPFSTMSSLGTSYSVTPPPVTEQLPLPMYYPEPPMLLPTDGVTESLNWADSPTNGWHGNHSEDDSWNLIPVVPEWMPTDVCNLYHEPPNSYPRPMSTVPTLVTPPLAELNHITLPETAPKHLTPHVSTGADTLYSTSDSDSDSEGDDDTASSSSPSPRYTTRTRTAHANSPILRLGRWSTQQPPCTTPDARHYACRYSLRPAPDGKLCNKRFLRPEHLRRHEKTVHLDQRDYACKVPECGRAFSRGDNLRDHYWTHLHRGGRVGTNAKMGLAELKAILGPREKKLVRTLRRKLRLQREKVLKSVINGKGD